MRYYIFLQEWEESESGWGTRPDGFFAFLSQEDAEKGTILKVNEMRQRESKIYKGQVPDEYSRPYGKPFAVETCEEYYQLIENYCKNNVMGYYVNHKSEVLPPGHFPK